MRIGIIASPFISVPPARYGGTELFVASLAESLAAMGVDVVVYANGESRVQTEVRWRYPRSEWPLPSEMAGMTKELDHISWAVEEAAAECDLIHVNSALAIPYSRFSARPMVHTLHHPYEAALSEIYERYPNVRYVAISRRQASFYSRMQIVPVHHGIDMSQYRLGAKKDGYLCFLGRIAPIKGAHVAIEVAKRCGIPLKIAGEVQPVFRDYFESEIKPQIDGRLIEYLGEADLAMKNELLGGAQGLLFPIDWEEPFGLVMVEAMACGTPVFAFGKGAVPEIVRPGVAGRICGSAAAMVKAVANDSFSPHSVRQYAELHFSAEVMARKYLALYRRILEEEPSIFPAGGVVAA